MRHQPSQPSGRCSSRKKPLLTSMLVAAALLLVPAGAGANQVFKQCGKDWVKQTKKLSPEQLTWRLKQRFAEFRQDLDGDGMIDTLVLTNWPSYRNCDLKKTWNKKEVTIKIEYGHGKTRIIDWMGEQLVESLKVYTEAGKILVVGVDSHGEANNRWVRYRDVEEPTPATVIAGPSERAGETERLQLAGLQ